MATSVEYLIRLRDRFSPNLRKMNNNLNKFSDQINDTKKRLRGMQMVQEKMASTARRLTIGATLPIVGALGLMSKEAINAQETFSKFDTVFKDVGLQAETSAKVLSESFGLARVDAKQLLSDTGDLLTGFGFSGKAALELSEEVNKLAVDLASFTNFTGGAEGASRALTKALLGERESIKSLGISILEEDVKARVKQLIVVDKMRFATMRQAKAFATLQLAQEQSKNAIGDFARTQSQAANQLRIARAQFKDVRIEIGTLLVPVITKLLQKMIPILRNAADWVRNNKELTKTFIKVAAGIALLGPVLGFIATATAAVTGLAAAAAVLGVSFGWVSGVVAGITLLVKGVQKLRSIMPDGSIAKGLSGDASQPTTKFGFALPNQGKTQQQAVDVNNKISLGLDKGLLLRKFSSDRPDTGLNVAPWFS